MEKIENSANVNDFEIANSNNQNAHQKNNIFNIEIDEILETNLTSIIKYGKMLGIFEIIVGAITSIFLVGIPLIFEGLKILNGTKSLESSILEEDEEKLENAIKLYSSACKMRYIVLICGIISVFIISIVVGVLVTAIILD